MANPYLLMILISVAVTLAYAAGRFEYPLWLMLAGAFAMQLLGYYVVSISTMLVI